MRRCGCYSGWMLDTYVAMARVFAVLDVLPMVEPGLRLEDTSLRIGGWVYGCVVLESTAMIKYHTDEVLIFMLLGDGVGRMEAYARSVERITSGLASCERRP